LIDKSNKVKLLIVPSNFPENDQDIRGIFIKDYATCTMPYCDTTIFAWAFSEKRTLNTFKWKSCTVHYMYLKKRKGPIGKIIQYLDLYRSGKKYLKKLIKEADIVHAHNGTIAGTLAAKLANEAKTANVLTEHSGPFSKVSNHPVFFRLCKYAMENCNAVLPVSRDLQKQITQTGIRPKNFHVLFNPVDTELFHIDKSTERENSFIFVSRLENYKGGLRTIKAFQTNLVKHPSWSLKIIGDGPEMNEIKTYLEANNLTKKVLLLGFASKQRIAEEMKKSKIFVFPSEHETFGLVVAEAMSAGLPVITSNTTAMPEYVKQEHGILVNPLSIDDITNAMDELIRTYSQYNLLQIRQHIVSIISFKEFGRNMLEVYKKYICAE
jgi:glycosyltransferase involved in cell wall biosynthesis